MNSRRSYLETFNAGRSKRPHASLEELAQSLELLDERIRRSNETYASDGEPQRAVRDDQGRSAWMAQDLERPRSEDDTEAATIRLAEEFQSLRGEIIGQEQQGLNSEIRQEAAGYRQEIIPSSVSDSAATSEVDRLTAAVAELSARHGAEGVHELKGELEQVRVALDQLAREDSVRTIGQRWDGIEKRLGHFESQLSEERADRVSNIAVTALHTRLDGLEDALRKMPTSRTMETIEERLRLLGEVSDQLAAEKDRLKPVDHSLLEDRLEEISRAIVASALSMQQAAQNPEPLARIEARLATMSRQVEAIGTDEPSDEIMQRLTQLADRVDDLANRANLPVKAVEQLSTQVAIIAAKLDTVPAPVEPDFIFKNIEQRFEALSDMLERRQGDAAERSALLFRDLEKRLDEVADRLDGPAFMAGLAASNGKTTILEAIDARFEDFARKIEERAPAGEGDAKLIRSLEAQVKVMTEHLSRPGAARAELEEITPRLDGIERSLSGTRDSIVAAAREAAENAVRSLDVTTASKAAVAGLTDDLKTLEALTRRSDERNSKTFEAIHDTLIKIVERLALLEPGSAYSSAVGEEEAEEPQAIAVDDAPSLEMEPPVLEIEQTPDAPAPEASKEPEAAPKRSMLRGLSRALRGRKSQIVREDATSQPLAGDPPALDLEVPITPRAANRPIEPNTGGPDLGAIMRRVRDERAAAPKTDDPDAAKSDFIAAARRAAQAAAAEAEMLKRKSGPSKGGSTRGIAGIFKQRHKPILMGVGAVMLALAGLQVSNMIAVEQQYDDVPLAANKAEMPISSPAKAEPRPVLADAGNMGETTASIAREEAPAPVMSSLPSTAAPDAGAVDASIPAAASPDVVAGDNTAEASATPAPAPSRMGDAAIMSVPAEIAPAALREAAENGDAKALFEVGSRLAEGRGVTQDQAAGAKWVESAAALGLAPAEYRMGSFLEKGTGVGRDLKAARDFYQRAADKGNASAMHNLAVLSAMGVDGAANNEAAARWFTAAAEHGVKDSQFNLGILAAKGVGMKRNLEDSYKWFALVAKTGDTDAAQKRDEIGKSLKTDELKRAQAAADVWKAKPLDAEANSVEIPDSWIDAAPAGNKTSGVDMTAAVKTIQLILNKNGYEAGGADGKMGMKTKAAIAQFQKDNDLTPTGEVDHSLVKALLARK